MMVVPVMMMQQKLTFGKEIRSSKRNVIFTSFPFNFLGEKCALWEDLRSSASNDILWNNWGKKRMELVLMRLPQILAY